MSDASIPHIGVLVKPARALEITFTTHAQKAMRMLNCVSCFGRQPKKLLPHAINGEKVVIDD